MKKFLLLLGFMSPMVVLIFAADMIQPHLVHGFVTISWVSGCFSGILMWLMIRPKEDPAETFKQQFITSFIASQTVSNYDEACYTGNHERLEHFPIEDAHYLAEKAWEKWKENAKP